MRRAIINGILSGFISALLIRNHIMPNAPEFWAILLSVWAMIGNSML